MADKKVPKILLVENDEYWIDTIRQAVTMVMYYQFTSARDIHEAHQQISTKPPDLVVVDLDNAFSDALEFGERIREETATKRLPLLAISSNEARKEEAFARGYDAFLKKPFKVHELDVLVGKLLSVG